MRQTASGLNRGWLAVLGVLLILAGAAGVLISTGLWVTLAAAAGLGLDRPAATSHVIGSEARSRNLVRVVRIASMSSAVIGRGSRSESRTRTVRRTGCWRLAAPTNGWCRSGTRPSAWSTRRCIGFSPAV